MLLLQAALLHTSPYIINNMNKKTLVFLIVMAIIAAAFVFWLVQRGGEPVQDTVIPDGAPFGASGGGISHTLTPEGLPVSEELADISSGGARLRQVSNVPVAGFGFVGEAASARLRFVERATGHINEAAIQTSTLARVSNITVPRVYEAMISQSGSALLRTVDDFGLIDTIILPAGTSSASSFPAEATSIALSPDRNRIAYLEPTQTGSRLVVSNPDGSQVAVLRTFALRDWLVDWPVANTVSVTTKASGAHPGVSYLINPANGSITSGLSGINGLTVRAGNAGRVLFSNTNNGFGLFADLGAGENIAVSPVTLPEKCIWSSRQSNTVICFSPREELTSQYPDVWYQGLARFTDSVVWVHNLADGLSAVLLAIPESANIDAINPTLSPNEDYLAFINRNDGILWLIDVGDLEIAF